MNPNTIPMQTTWTKEFQITHYKLPVYPAITNYRLAPDLQKGDTVKRTYARQFVTNNMSGAGGFTRQNLVNTEESLTIDKVKDTSFYIKKLDEIQSHLPTRTKYAHLANVALHQQIDADVLGQYAQFTTALDAASFGGTTGDGIQVTSANVTQLFSQSTSRLQKNSIMIDVAAKFTAVKAEDSDTMGIAVISPEVYASIIERLDGKNSQLGDTVGVQGHVGKYMNYELLVSNSLAWTGTLSMVTQPTDGDTVVIGGVTFTFKTTLGSTAGNVLIGGSADAARANLANLINNPGTTDSNGVALSSTPDSNGFSDQDRFKNVTATNSNSLDTMTLVALGKGSLVVSDTMVASADGFTPALQIQHCLVGTPNGIDLVIQQSPSLEIKDRDGYIGKDVVTWCAYGMKVFNDGKPKMVDVKVRTDGYSY